MVGRQTTNGAQSLMEKRNRDTPMRREREAGMARARSGGDGVTQTERDTEGEREPAEQ